MRQYLDLCEHIVQQGEWVNSGHGGYRCKTVIGVNMIYDMRDERLPILTTRDMTVLNSLDTELWRAAVGEFLGYLKGYDNAAQFRTLGCNTWDANANKNAQWLENSYRKGDDDMGRVYGVQARQWDGPDGTVDQLQNVYEHLAEGSDNRAEIITFWNPGELHMGCLKPCMHTHTFSLMNGMLHLTSEQRSDDVPLGHAFNQIQCGFFLQLMAQITGNAPGIVHHNIVNAHIYENQLERMIEEHLPRKPRPLPKLCISAEIRTLTDVISWMTPEHVWLEGYDPHPAIHYPFSV